MLLWASIILVGIAAFIIARTFFMDEDAYKAQEKLDDDETSKDKNAIAKHGIVLRYSRPFFKRYISPTVSGMKNRKKIREKYKRPLASAGLTEIMSPDDFFSFKLFLILGFPIVFLGVRAFMEADWPLTYVPLVSVVGYFYPNIWVNGKIQMRQKEITGNMPFAVDMLALSVEAGLDFIAAMTKVVEKSRDNALTEEFSLVLKEIRIGASRAEALRNLAWRTDLIQISSFVATLIAADSVGASIGPILKALSAEIRQKRSADIEKQAATAATKILFPMMVFIVPAVFIIIFTPIALEFAGGK